MYPFKGMYMALQGISRRIISRKNLTFHLYARSVQSEREKEKRKEIRMEKKCELRECWVSCLLYEWMYMCICAWFPVGATKRGDREWCQCT